MSKSANKLLVPKLERWRLFLAAGAICCALATVAGRAMYLQGINHAFLQEKGDAIATRELTLPPNRGIILDRNGKLLAVSAPVEALWARASEISAATPEQLAQLATVLGTSPSQLSAKLNNRRGDVSLGDTLSPEQAVSVVALGIPGIHLEREYRRYYPYAESVAHVVGFANVDNVGQEGMELALNERLSGKSGKRKVLKDRRGHIVSDVGPEIAKQDGQNTRLSIDMDLQYLAYREVSDAVREHNALAGSAIVIDAKTGEVLAMANAPAYNPNNRKDYSPSTARNRAVVDDYEPGSVMKPFTVAAGLLNKVITPDTVIDTRPGYRVGNKVITDTHPSESLDITEIIKRSSNIGAAHVALRMEPRQFWGVLDAAGFGKAPGLGFPGEARGRLRNPATWKPVEQATMAYGHGLSVTLMQLAHGYTIFANNGVLVPVTLLKQGGDGSNTPAARQVRVVPPLVAQQVLTMMKAVTGEGGTAPLAQVPGYTTAGKTGTAHKLIGGRYSPDKYLASFIGLAPATNPRIIVAVTIDQPVGQYYGGIVAAPVFSHIAAGALHMLNVPMDNMSPGTPTHTGPAERKFE